MKGEINFIDYEEFWWNSGPPDFDKFLNVIFKLKIATSTFMWDSRK